MGNILKMKFLIKKTLINIDNEYYSSVQFHTYAYFTVVEFKRITSEKKAQDV